MSKARGVSLGLANGGSPGHAKLAKAQPTGLTRRASASQLLGGGMGWDGSDAADALSHGENTDISTRIHRRQAYLSQNVSGSQAEFAA